MPVDKPVDPPKPVEVLYHGLWVSGHLAAWRNRNERWTGFVELQVLRSRVWFDEEEVRPTSEPPDSPDRVVGARSATVVSSGGHRSPDNAGSDLARCPLIRGRAITELSLRIVPPAVRGTPV